MKPLLILWVAILTGPLAWFLNLEANFALAPLACTGRGKMFLHLVAAITFIMALTAACTSYVQLNLRTRRADGETAAAPATYRTLAMAGLVLNAFSLLVIVAQAIPNFMLEGCE